MNCNHNILVIGSEGNLGPFWVKHLRDRNMKNQIHASYLKSVPDLDSNNISFLQFDVTNFKQNEFQNYLKENSICRIVYNSGIDSPPIKKYDNVDFYSYRKNHLREMLEVNLVGAIEVSQALGKVFENLNHGVLVFIGSLYSKHAPDPRYYINSKLDPIFHKSPAYGSSKAGLVSLARYLASIWGEFQVRVNVLSPGGVEGNQDQSFKKKFTDRIPLGRMADVEKDLAPVLNFLLSTESIYITGQEISVDGGYSIW